MNRSSAQTRHIFKVTKISQPSQIGMNFPRFPLLTCRNPIRTFLSSSTTCLHTQPPQQSIVQIARTTCLAVCLMFFYRVPSHPLFSSSHVCFSLHMKRPPVVISCILYIICARWQSSGGLIKWQRSLLQMPKFSLIQQFKPRYFPQKTHQIDDLKLFLMFFPRLFPKMVGSQQDACFLVLKCFMSIHIFSVLKVRTHWSFLKKVKKKA